MVKEYTIKILKKFEAEDKDPFMWEVNIIEDDIIMRTVNITSWDKRDLKEGETYKIKLLDETGNDAAHDMRRMQKGNDPILVGDDVVAGEIIEKEEPKNESTLIVDKTIPIKKKEIIWKQILPPKKEAIETKIQDEFDEEFGSMIAAEEKEKETKSSVKSTQSLVISKGNELEVSLKNIKKYLFVQNVTDSEYYMFMQLCINQNLNPFIGDVYLVKYGPKAQMIVSKDAFLKKAELTKGYLGFEAGVVVFNKENKTFEQREGSLVRSGEGLAGGWARVKRKDMQLFYAEVSFDEYNTKKAMWNTKPATMIRKVALVQCLREAFPSSFQGMYDGAEIDTEAKQ